MALELADFPAFFLALHGRQPFLWQTRLAQQVAIQGWPDVIDLPTASGKTACVDIAVFHLALNPSAARRIFFVVDRRLIVNQVFDRMGQISKKINEASEGVLLEVATRLKSLAGPGGESPLESYELRGGVYRDPSWVKTPLQPTLISSTVDQVGSRILFRGYGVSDSVRPIHAGLVANDSLIFLDEAHCSPAFARTLQSIERYRGSEWSDEPSPRSFRFIEMTATPTRDSNNRFQLIPEDKAPGQLASRIFANKPTRLVEGKYKPSDPEKSADAFIKEVYVLLKNLPSAKRIAVIVNRIATARAIYTELSKQAAYGGNVHLMIGRMRPIDRDGLTTQLEPLKSGAPRLPEEPVRIVVATQCLEVGADLDFDLLVTECASIDALLQRFGRLNRLGAQQECGGAIITATVQAEGKNPDPIYGESLARTWKWLNSIAAPDQTVNMGIEAPPDQPATAAQTLVATQEAGLRIPDKISPALLPAHLDALCQTNPAPACEPSVDLFLHGIDSGEPDVQVVWRADLDPQNDSSWAEIVELCPPVSAEAMPVRISTVRKWLSQGGIDTNASDLEGQGDTDEKPLREKPRTTQFLRIRGKEKKVNTSPGGLRPGDTIVLPVSAGGWDDLGHIPPNAPKDCGDHAQEKARNRRVIRLHPELIDQITDCAEDRADLKALVKDSELQIDDLLEALPQYLLVGLDRKSARSQCYPGGGAYIIQSKLGKQRSEDDDGDDGTSRSSRPVRLTDHINHVVEAVEQSESVLGNKFPEFIRAAQLHDHGKSDVRFQTLLRNGDALAARLALEKHFLAKSGSMAPSNGKSAAKQDYPNGFRHELLSLLFAEQKELSELALHLIATHHGYCRPFAPVIEDDDPPAAAFQGLRVTSSGRLAKPMHHLSSGLLDRFWRLTRRHGWWGLAYYETLFRLADWSASASEAEDGGQQ